MKTFKKIMIILVMIILLLILSFNIFNFISIKFLGNDLPTINGYAVLEVVSGSMEPEISIGDLVIIDTKINNYKEKDIVTFKDINGSYVTHRIIEINDDVVVTKGDFNNTIDDSINTNQIVGRYVYKIDSLGALMKSFRSPLTLIMILIIGIISCILASTDSKGNVILTEEEKEYMEFLESKKKKSIENKKQETNSKNKETTTKKTATTKKSTKAKKETVPKKKAIEKKVTNSKKETQKKVTTTKKETTKKDTMTKKEVVQKKKTSNKKIKK